MTDRPFGFGLPDKPDDQGGQGSSGPGGAGGASGPGSGGPFGGAGPFGAMGDPGQFADALHQFADMLSYQGGPVNWDLAKNIARHAIVAAGDPSVLDAQRREVTEAVRLADLWLDEATAFPSGVRKIEAWSRSEWVEATFPVWAKLCDPVAAKGVEAMSGMLNVDPSQLGDDVPEEMRQALAGLGGGAGALAGLQGLAGMMRQMGGAMFGSQIGTAVGELAREVVGSTDIGLPLGPARHRGAAPGERDRSSAQGLAVAQTRSGCTWPCARPPTSGCSRTCRGCARTCSARSRSTPAASRSTCPAGAGHAELDPSQSRGAAGGAAGEGMFQPEDTPAQKAALARLETALALVEGWVDDRGRGRGRAPAARRRRAARDDPPAPRHRRSGRADLRHPGRAGAAARAGCARRPRSGGR